MMVVFIHSSGFGEFQTDSFNFSALADINLYDFLRIMVSQILCQVAVPLFFIISGYLFYTKFDDQSWSWEIWIKKNKDSYLYIAHSLSFLEYTEIRI